MNFFKTIFRFYINASIHVALAVVALLIFTYFQYQITLDFSLISFVFLSSITGYNFVKYAPIAKLYHRRLTNQLKQIQIFSLVCFIGLCIVVFFVNFQVLWVCAVLGFLTLLYAIPVWRKNLRETSLLKVFIIAFIWATTTYVLPFLDKNQGICLKSQLWYFDYAERFVWVVLLMIPFEIRDLRFDQKQIKTLVSVFGVLSLKITSIVILILLSIQKFIQFNTEEVWLYLVIYMSLAIAILASKTKQKPYYASFCVEALPIFWLIILWLFCL